MAELDSQMGLTSSGALPSSTSVLAVCAHPDDESFGLGALLDLFARTGSSVSVLCFTHGEASTLGYSADLGRVRQGELTEAAEVLGARNVRLLDFADGALCEQPSAVLVGEVLDMAGDVGADLLLAFDEGGITGHPDHMAATGAAVHAAARLGLPVLGWALEKHVADALNASFPGATFTGRAPSEIDIDLAVDRAHQMQAIACHRTQSFDNPVLGRRLDLQGPIEVLRWLTGEKGVLFPGAPGRSR